MPRVRHQAPVTHGSDKQAERIASAATRLTDGSIYTGQLHGDAYASACSAHRQTTESRYHKLFEQAEDGFTTSAGRFVSRDEAYRLAVKCGQLNPTAYAGTVEDLWGSGVTAGEELCAMAFTNARVL